jgi:hypothetical protein
MKKIAIIYFVILLIVVGCADNDLDVKPNDQSFPFRVILDTDEGADLPDAEDYGLEITFADYIGKLPDGTITLTYEIEGEDSFKDAVEIDKVVYEVEIGDCAYERELSFNPATKTIVVVKDPDLGGLPESFEVQFELPGEDGTEGGFEFKLTGIQAGSQNIVIGEPRTFEYEVLDNEVAGEWELELETEAEFERFQDLFGSISNELKEISFDEISGKVKVEFEFKEMKFEIELKDEEEVCEDGDTETENKVIEIEAEYDAEEGELKLEGSHLIIGDDGEVEDELDFEAEASFEIDRVKETITFLFLKIIDEDNFEEGEELFSGEESFTFKKD